jgi:hypothetical protein
VAKLILLLLIAGFAFAQVVLPDGPPPVVPPPPPHSANAKKPIEPPFETSGNASCVIELKTGQRIEGALKQATAAGAVIEVAGQSITIPLEKLKTIYFGAVPSATVTGPAPFQEALDALKALKSVTNSGITYHDYSQRVLDARVKVDRYLSTLAQERKEPGDRAIRVAMLEYEMASQVWLTKTDPPANASLWRPIGITMQDPDVAKCTVVKAATLLNDNPPAPASSRKRTASPNPSSKMDRTESLGLTLAIAERSLYWSSGSVTSGVWACATAQLASAERSVSER